MAGSSTLLGAIDAITQKALSDAQLLEASATALRKEGEAAAKVINTDVWGPLVTAATGLVNFTGAIANMGQSVMGISQMMQSQMTGFVPDATGGHNIGDFGGGNVGGGSTGGGGAPPSSPQITSAPSNPANFVSPDGAG